MKNLVSVIYMSSFPVFLSFYVKEHRFTGGNKTDIFVVKAQGLVTIFVLELLVEG